MTGGKTPSTPKQMPEAKATEAASDQTEPSVAASPTPLPQDLDTAISRAAHQVQLIEFLAAHQRPIKYASYAVKEAISRKRSNRLSGEDVARKWLLTATQEIETWMKQTKQMVDEVEKAGSSRGEEEK